MSLLKKLEEFVRNGILSLKDLKKKSLPLYNVVTNPDARNLVKDMEILTDVCKLRTEEDVIKFLKLHFDNVVDITLLRKNFLSTYKNINSRGNVKAVLKGWGFKVVYSSRDAVSKVLTDPAITNPKLSKRLYNKLYFAAKKQGITVNDLLKILGYEVKEISMDYVCYLRDNQGFSYREISDYLGISTTNAFRIYRRKYDDRL
jgi:hypothetical protein